MKKYELRFSIVNCQLAIGLIHEGCNSSLAGGCHSSLSEVFNQKSTIEN